jgi:membrane protein DedA with SNARE-associated domain
VKPVPLALAALVLVCLGIFRGRLTRTLIVLGVVVAAGLAVSGSGLIEFDLEHAIRQIGPTLGAWAYLLVGLLAFLETGAFVGLVAPGEFAVLMGGFIAGQGEINVFALVAIVWAAAAAGDAVSYLLGRKLGRGFLVRHGPKFHIEEGRLKRVEDFFRAHGGKTILIGRFLGLVRAIAPFLAGASRLPARKFFPVDLIAAGLWSATFVTLGYVFWQSFDQLVSFAKKGNLALGVVVVLVVAIVLAVRFLRRPENRRRIRAALEKRRLGWLLLGR